MRRTSIFLVTLFINMWALTTTSHASEISQSSAYITDIQIFIEEKDERSLKLSQFLKSHNSPLVPYADLFIKKAEEYDLSDWKLVPAISGVESTFGKHIPKNSFNAWGWANGAYSFSSWENAIDEVTKTISQKYIARGLDTPEKMSPVYAPPSTTWAGKVRFFMKKMDDFETPETLSLSI